MKTQYQITEDNYVHVMRLAWKRSTKERIVFGLIACALGFLALYNLQNGFDSWASWILIALVVYFFATPYILPLIARRTYKKYQDDIGQPRAVELTDGGLLFTTADTKNLVRWDKIKKWKQDENYILIYVMPQIIHIIPKSLDNQNFEIERLTGILNGLFKK